MKKNLSIGFVGLSHLGLCYLAASSAKGFKAIGIDLNKNKINKLKKFKIEYSEPNLKKTIFRNKKNIFFSSNIKNLINCQIVFVSQDIATNNQDKGDFNNLKKLIGRVSKTLNKRSIMVILSQVKPGFTRRLKFDHVRLYYQVETLVFGNALKRALNPERFIIGCHNTESKISSLFLDYLEKFNCPILKMNYESAEIAKISINLLLSASVSASNILAEVCERTNASWSSIVPALQLDKRIGKDAYIKAGLGISGGNLERDIRILIDMNKKHKIQSDFLNSILSYSKKRKNWVWEKLVKLGVMKKSNLRIAILGLTYKANTNSIKNSASIELVKKLIRKHYVTAYDPVATNNIKSKNFMRAPSIIDAVNKTNIIILMTPWPEFESIDLKKIGNLMQGKIIIDPFSVLIKNNFLNLKKNYYSLGNFK